MTIIMGILNVTPDSFSDGGEHLDADAAIAHGLALIADGADWVDVGGESTAPGTTPIDPEVECARVLPVVEALAGVGGGREKKDEVRLGCQRITDLAEGSAQRLIPGRCVDHRGGRCRRRGAAVARHVAPPCYRAAPSDKNIVRPIEAGSDVFLIAEGVMPGQVQEVALQSHLIVLPRHAVHAGRGMALERQERIPQQIDR